jgi:hypothetical protein
MEKVLPAMRSSALRTFAALFLILTASSAAWAQTWELRLSPQFGSLRFFIEGLANTTIGGVFFETLRSETSLAAYGLTADLAGEVGRGLLIGARLTGVWTGTGNWNTSALGNLGPSGFPNLTFDFRTQQQAAFGFAAGDIRVGLTRSAGERLSLTAFVGAGWRQFLLHSNGGTTTSTTCNTSTTPATCTTTTASFTGGTIPLSSPAFGTGLAITVPGHEWTLRSELAYSALTNVGIGSNIVVPGAGPAVTTTGQEWNVRVSLERPLSKTLTLSVGYDGTFPRIVQAGTQTISGETPSLPVAWQIQMLSVVLVWRF